MIGSPTRADPSKMIHHDGTVTSEDKQNADGRISGKKSGCPAHRQTIGLIKFVNCDVIGILICAQQPAPTGDQLQDPLAFFHLLECNLQS